MGDPFLLLTTLEGSSLFFFFSILDPDMPAKGGKRRERVLWEGRERGMMIFLLLPFWGKTLFGSGKKFPFNNTRSLAALGGLCIVYRLMAGGICMQEEVEEEGKGH